MNHEENSLWSWVKSKQPLNVSAMKTSGCDLVLLANASADFIAKLTRSDAVYKGGSPAEKEAARIIGRCEEALTAIAPMLSRDQLDAIISKATAATLNRPGIAFAGLAHSVDTTEYGFTVERPKRGDRSGNIRVG